MFDFDFFTRRLSVKILLALTVGVAMAMGVVIYLSLDSQQKQIRERMTTFGRELKFLAYAGIKHPMSVGDSASVEKQLLDVKEILKDAEIAVCDFNQRIVFATHESRINMPVAELIHNQEALDGLERLLATGEPLYEKSFEEEVEGKRYLITIHRMANEPECHHCHGASRKVLGGMIVRQSADETYAAIASLRNRTIGISIVGIGALIAIIYFLLARLVTRPVTELAEKAEQLAGGDLSVSVQVKSRDAVGVLGNAFNSMVASIKSQIEYANSLKDAIADPLFMVDTDMVITFMNEACAELTGYTKEEVEGKLTCREIFNSDICETTCPIRYCFENGGPVKGIMVNMTKRDGGRTPLMASASALRDARGTLVGGVEICKDISDVLEAERLRYIDRAAAQEEEQRRYLEDRGHRLLDVLSNVSAGDLHVRAEVLGKNDVMDEIAQHTNLMLENIEKLYEKLSSFSRELELEVARRTMMLREKTLLLERANRELRELDRLKSSFLANMSHELRTPMNSIIGYTDLMLDRVDGEINEEQEKSLAKVGNNARHLLQLINDILDMSKIESGKIELELREVSVKDLVESFISTFEPPMAKKGLHLVVNIEPELPMVYVDMDKIRQVFINLMSNAVKFTNQGTITIGARPSLRGIKPGEAPLFVDVCVVDTGIGIKQEDIGKLFDKFSQIDVSTIRQYEGTGLGLSIARGLVVLHKGVIWVESEYGRGSRFCFTLPVRKEMLDKPEEPLVEAMMAEGLAKYFDKPVATFLKEPQYAGKPITCWEYVHCGQTSCPAYGSQEHRCWLIYGTHCKGTQIAAYPEKVEFCKGCEIIERLILEEYEAREAEQRPAADGIGQDARKKTVLAIDDNPEVIELIKKYIGGDYNVIGLLSGEGAVEKARIIKPVAITLDIMMPKKNGWNVLLDLKRTPATQDIPVIILSIVDEKKLGFSLGAAEYLVKPIDKVELLRKLRYLEKTARIRKVLIVDNDQRTLKMIRQVLVEAAYTVTTAANNREAINAIATERPDLIVLNLIMPDQNGFDVIEYIRTEESIKNIPLIVLTSKNLDDQEIEKLDGRIQAILNKGLLTDEAMLAELKETIRRCDVG